MAVLCRCCRGLEPPEVAKAWLANGTFQPCPAIDMWAFGLLVLHLLGAQRPPAHEQLTRSQAWAEAMAHGGSQDPRHVPLLREHLEYLESLTHSGQDDYFNQVGFQHCCFAFTHCPDYIRCICLVSHVTIRNTSQQVLTSSTVCRSHGGPSGSAVKRMRWPLTP